MITKRKKPLPMPAKATTAKTAPARGATVRDRRPATAPSRSTSTRRRTSLRRDVQRGRGLQPKAHIGLFETALHSVLSFAGVALAVSCVASLAGNVMLEATRRGTIEAQNRLRAETAGREDLKSRLATITSSDAIDRWAMENGFQSADEVPTLSEPREGRSLVARR